MRWNIPAVLFVSTMCPQAACELEPCKAFGDYILQRHQQLIDDALRGEAAGSSDIYELAASFPRLRFNVSTAVASFVPAENNLANKLTRSFLQLGGTTEVLVNALYDSYIEELGYHRWFRALWSAVSSATKDDAPMFLTASNKQKTGYPDWHWLAAHASATSKDRGALLGYFGSRVDMSFMVHGAAWAAVVNASASGLFHFSDSLQHRSHLPSARGSRHGDVELILAPGFQILRDLCPWSVLPLEGGNEEEQGGEEDYPWMAECRHGMGHGVLMASIESLAQAEKPISVSEVMRRSAALSFAILSGDVPAISSILTHGTAAMKLDSWMVAADIDSASHEFERAPERYGWHANSSARWKSEFAEFISQFPSGCTALTPSIPRKWAAAAEAPVGPFKDDDNLAVSACLSQLGKYGFRILKNTECLNMASSPSLGGIGSITCATMSGAIYFMSLHHGNYHKALHSCRYSYLEEGVTQGFPKTVRHPHYKACVSGEKAP